MTKHADTEILSGANSMWDVRDLRSQYPTQLFSYVLKVYDTTYKCRISFAMESKQKSPYLTPMIFAKICKDNTHMTG